ncbi:hemerythrin family protein [Zoogloea sp.]|uniref:bacteriohemerythrin n=1 Tax=Zoogloea sp. TaxID=49181 RepID=UPI001415D59A|nr:MAG: hypothetical protein F9K15_17680 [Zoogloea sp.]
MPRHSATLPSAPAPGRPLRQSCLNMLTGYSRQRLLRLIDSLLTAERPPTRSTLSEMMSEFFEHAIVHFEAEDAWLSEIGYPDASHHSSEHRSLVETFSDVCFLIMESHESPWHAFLDRICIPLYRHLTEEDRKVISFLEARHIA